MCDATNFRVGRMDELRCALRLPPRRALRFSIPIAAIERDENWQIHDFTLFLLRLFYDPPNFLKKRDAPNRVVTTSRKGFQNFKEIRVFPCAKADRDRKFRNLKNMFPLAEAVFPLAEYMSPLAETAVPLARRQGTVALLRPRTRTQNQKFNRVVSVLKRFFVPGSPEVRTPIRLGADGTKKTKNRSGAKGSHTNANSRKIHEKNEKSKCWKRKPA